MSFPRGYLAATLAGVVITAAPSFAQSPRPVAKTVSTAPVSATTPTGKNDVLTQAEDYSMGHPVIVIAIAKGQKETLLTGEQIGDKLCDAIQKIHGLPAKYFVAPGGDYTAIAYFVKGHAYGPYGLKESLGGLSLAANDYNDKVRQGVFPVPETSAVTAPHAPSFAAKPEPHQ